MIILNYPFEILIRDWWCRPELTGSTEPPSRKIGIFSETVDREDGKSPSTVESGCGVAW